MAAGESLRVSLTSRYNVPDPLAARPLQAAERSHHLMSRKSGTPGLTPRTPAAAQQKGRGRAGAKRLAPPRRAAAVGTPALRRLARRAGVKRVALPTWDKARAALACFLRTIVGDACVLADHRRRHTVTLPDVMFALKRNGRTLYGWSGEGEGGARRDPWAGKGLGCIPLPLRALTRPPRPGGGHSARVQRLAAPVRSPRCRCASRAAGAARLTQRPLSRAGGLACARCLHPRRHRPRRRAAAGAGAPLLRRRCLIATRRLTHATPLPISAR